MTRTVRSPLLLSAFVAAMVSVLPTPAGAAQPVESTQTIALSSSGTPAVFRTEHIVPVISMTEDEALLADGRRIGAQGEVPLPVVVAAVELAGAVLTDDLLAQMDPSAPVATSSVLWDAMAQADEELIHEIELHVPVELFIPEFQTWLDTFRVDLYMDFSMLVDVEMLDPTWLATMQMVGYEMYDGWFLLKGKAYRPDTGDAAVEVEVKPKKDGDSSSGDIVRKDTGEVIGDTDSNDDGWTDDWFGDLVGGVLLTGITQGPALPYSLRPSDEFTAMIDATVLQQMSTSQFLSAAQEHFGLAAQQQAMYDNGLLEFHID